MKKMMNRINRREGFTLAELLIVVAIIAVLVAVSIPVFTSQLEKAKEATDAANLRAAYAECSAAAMLETASGSATYADGKATATVSIKQSTAGWVSGTPDIGGIAAPTDVKNPDTVTVTVSTDGTIKTIEKN